MFEEIDGKTKCVIRRIKFSVDSASEIAGLLQIESEADLSKYSFDLSAEDISKISQLPDLSEINRESLGRLRPPHRLDDLPYEIHTGRELQMMLNQEKPMAYFSFCEGESLSDFCDQPFGDYVLTGKLIEYKLTLGYGKNSEAESSGRKIHYVIYTLPGEEWRAKCMMYLLRLRIKGLWDRDLEMMEGELLGYSEEENNFYINNFYKNRI